MDTLSLGGFKEGFLEEELSELGFNKCLRVIPLKREGCVRRAS